MAIDSKPVRCRNRPTSKPARAGRGTTGSALPLLGPRYAFATHSAVLPRTGDGCIARMMRKPNHARMTSDAALLLS